jgi:hypothetical protein
LMIEVEFSGASLLLKLWRETEFCTNLSTWLNQEKKIIYIGFVRRI